MLTTLSEGTGEGIGWAVMEMRTQTRDSEITEGNLEADLIQYI